MGGAGQPGNRPGLAAIRDVRRRVHEILDAHPTNTGFSPADLAVLSLYEGGGGLNEEGATSADTLYAFFTSPEIIGKVWELVDAYAPGAKSVLEPAGGTGRFAAGRPGNDFTIQEIDPINARIAQILHPNAKIRVGAYESNFFDDTGRVHRRENPDEALYDLVVGNFPYGANSSEWRGRGEGREFDRIEEYFASRGLDALKAGGLMACVMPSGFLRTLPDRAKEILAEKGELIDAWRLPNKAFATTDVGTDIVVFRRSDLRQRAEEAVAKSEMAGGQPIEGATREEKIANAMAALRAERMANLGNDGWFASHPERVCGVEETRMGRFGEEKYVRLADGDADLAAALGRIAPDPAIAAAQAAVEAPKTKIQKRPRRERGEAPRHQQSPAKSNVAPEDVPTHSAEAFARKYGKEYSEELMEVWRKSNYEGVVERRALSPAAAAYVASNPEYLEVRPGEYQHETLYASGNIYAKLDDLDAKQGGAEALPPEVYERNRQILLAAVPEIRPMEKIAFQPDTTLADEFTVEHFNAQDNETETLPLKQAFVRWATNCDADLPQDVQHNYQSHISNFSITPLSPDELPEDCRWSDVYDFIQGEPVRASIARNEQDKAANALKAAKTRDARMAAATKLFNRYLQEGLTPEQKAALCKEWNRRFNAVKQADYSKLPLFVDGMATDYKGTEFTLNDQQVRGIGFLCQSGNGLLAYDVGVGKTAAGIVAAVNQIQTGRAKRPLIVVPKSVHSKWVSDFRALFPGVKVNDLGNFSDAYLDPLRKPDDPHALNIEEGSVTICTREALQKISVTDASLPYLAQDFADIMGSDLADRREAVRDGGSRKAYDAELEKIKEAVGAGTKAKEGFVFFERCGFDCILGDEVHSYKNLYVQPRAKQKNGSNEYKALGTGTPSARAMKFFALTSLVQRANNGRNVFLLTATPFTNSPMEVYSMLSYMARSRLHDMGLNNLRDFVAEFAEIKSEWSVSAKGAIEMKQVMKNFQQLNSLQNLLTQYIDKVDGEEAGVIRPRKTTHKIMLKMTDVQKQIVEREIKRMLDPDASKNGGVLVAMNNMRMAMLSPALVNPLEYEGVDVPPPSELVESSPKLKLICDTVADGWKQHKDAGQVIYMPRGVEEYGQVAEYLVKKGIPRDAIGFIDSSVAPAKRDKLVTEFNDKGRPLKIIIGSETIAEGVDLNKNSIAIYNSMLGWNPTESVQVEGRIWRQGNEQGQVHVVYPFLADSIDALLMQKHDEKASRLAALWSYKGDKLNVSDIDPEELKFDLIRDPEVRANFIIDQRKAEFHGKRTILDKKIRDLEEIGQAIVEQTDRIAYLKERKEGAEADIARGRPENSDRLYNSGVLNFKREQVKECAAMMKDAQRLVAQMRFKLSRNDIDGPEGIAPALAKMAKQRDALDEEIQRVEKEKTAIIAIETEKLLASRTDANKPFEQTQAELSESILNNLRPMEEVKEEILAERAARDGQARDGQTTAPAAKETPPTTPAVQAGAGPAPAPAPAPASEGAAPEAAEQAQTADFATATATWATLPVVGDDDNAKAAAKDAWKQNVLTPIGDNLYIAANAKAALSKDNRAAEMVAVMETLRQPDIVYEADKIEGLFAVDTHHTYVRAFNTGDPAKPRMVVQIDTTQPVNNNPWKDDRLDAKVPAENIKISYATAEAALRENLDAAMHDPSKILYLAEGRDKAMGLDGTKLPGLKKAKEPQAARQGPVAPAPATPPAPDPALVDAAMAKILPGKADAKAKDAKKEKAKGFALGR